jgi:glycosyltransferase involved in cell wall biosynthesis
MPDHPSGAGGQLPPHALRVLMISLSEGILTGQGGGDVRDRHLEYARRIGHLHMIVYSPRAHDREAADLSERLTVYPTRSRSPLTFVPDAVRIGAGICRAEAVAGRPIDVITTQDPFSTGLAGWLLRRRCGAALDVQSHASFFDNRYWIRERPLRHGAFNVLGKWIARRADTLRVVNTDERARSIRAGVEPDRIEVINTPVNVDRFLAPVDAAEIAALRRALDLPESAPVILWVGRPVWFKRLPTLLDAFAIVRAEHPAARLVLVGDFSGAPHIPARVRALGLSDSVAFAGRVDHADLPAYYALADVYALSSVYEGLPKVLVEAAASATPAVSTAMAGGVDAVVDGETGLLAEIENPADFAARLSALLSDPERARAMGRRARERACDVYDRAATIERIVAMWSRCAAMRSRGAMRRG